ncbi:MAG TPA: choice-of-anchor D domain-containing protein, partial [Candidatus Kapabacteria bacterium]
MKNRITSFKVLFFGVVAALMLFSGVSFAQKNVQNMIVSSFSSTFTSIAGVAGTNTIYQLNGPSLVYYIEMQTGSKPTIALPFSFQYDGTTYPAGTTLYIGFGMVSFNNLTSNYYYNVINGVSPYPAGSYPNTIAPWTGLQVAYNSGASFPSTSNGGIYYTVTGVAPDRVLKIEWNKFGAYSASTYGATNYQVVLYEGTNTIEFLYDKSLSFQYSTYFQSVGLVGASANQNNIINATGNYNLPSVNYRMSFPANTQLSLSPEAMDFGAQFTGVATQGLVTAKHVGTEATLNLNTATISGPHASDFIVLSGPTPSNSVAINGTSTYAIQFRPSFGGLRTATLTIVSNGRDSGTQTVTLTGIGIAPKINVVEKELFKLKRVRLGDTLERTIVIQSTGQASLYFTNYPNSFTFTGDNPGDYRVSRVPVNPLPAGASDTLKIKFIPTVEGARPATVNVLSNAENSLSWPVLLKGIGVIPRITVDQSIVDADSVAMGQTSCKDITVSNPGSDTLRILKHYFASK